MAISKLILNGQVQMDVTSDTVTADKLMQGYTAHDNTGALITGMATDPSMHTVTLTNAGNEMTYVRYNGTKYYGLGDTISVNENEVIRISSSWGNSNRLFINDVLVAGGTSGQTVGYNYTMTSDVEIRFSLSLGTTDVYITELSDIEALTITQNGTYTASGSTRGYSPVTVSVSSGGGGFTVDQIAMRTISGDISGDAIYIGSYAFADCASLLSASFSKATKINAYAFADCVALSTISFPVVTTIGSYAFTGCNTLRTASFPSATTIAEYGFGGCKHLTTISFPLVTTIGSYAFDYCSSLTTASFPSATRISTRAFFACSSLTTISFPMVTTIGTEAFRACTSLSTISFPSASTVSGYAFAFCRSLTTAIFPVASIIEYYAFTNCNSLTTISFPLVTTIGSYAFNSCSNLTTVSFPLVSIVDSYAFSMCTSLTTASFPAVTTISGSAFVYCYNLLSLYLLGSSVPTLVSTAFVSTPISDYTTSTGGVYGSIFVPSSLYNSYITAKNWSIYSSRIVSV